MASVLRVSDAASIGLHAMVLLAASPERLLSNHEIATQLKVSEAHLSKVLQRLSRAGFVRATRGPRGGFRLDRPADEVTLLDVYEAIEGPVEPSSCLLGKPVCNGASCIFAGFIEEADRRIREYLASTTLRRLVTRQETLHVRP